MRYLVFILAIGFGSQVLASSVYPARLGNAVQNLYPGSQTDISCNVCHNGEPVLNPFGMDLFAQGLRGGGSANIATIQNFVAAVANLDSDGDNDPNAMEFIQGTDPGDPNSNQSILGNNNNPNPDLPGVDPDGDMGDLGDSLSTGSSRKTGSGVGANLLNGSCSSGLYNSDYSQLKKSDVHTASLWQPFVTLGFLLMPLGFLLTAYRKDD